jgi:acetyl-CoA acetyltransferase
VNDTKVTVVGAGGMGAGIAHTLAAASLEVVLIHINSDPGEKGIQRIEARCASDVKKGELIAEERDRLMARIRGTASAAVDAKIMGMGVVPSVRRALQFANLPMEAIDYWEINEAFAAQIIGCNRELKIPLDKLNAHGGGISLGDPVGMTGARLLVSLIHEMRRRGVRYGGASLCGGGGPSTSMIVEAIYE